MAIFDATNSNRARRQAVVARAEAASKAARVNVVFIESICDDSDLLSSNMLAKVRSSPDFDCMDEATALADLKERIANYESAYETLGDDEGAYVKLYNISSKVTAHQVFGRMTKSVVPYLMR